MKSVSDFIETILLHFPPFRWDEDQEKAWAQTMARELSGFTPEVLRKASDTMIRSRRERRIPLVSECIDACSDARRWLDANKRASSMDVGHAPATATEMKWNERTALADTLVNCPTGRQAAQEGWIGSLHSYAIKHGRLPPANEFPALKADAKETSMICDMVFRGEAPNRAGEVLPIPAMMRPILEKFAGNVLAKRHELERKVLGK